MAETLTLPNDAKTLENTHVENSDKMKYLDYSRSEKKYFVCLEHNIKIMTKYRKTAIDNYNIL